MAKSKTTVTQGYYQGENQILAFMKKELGDEKTAKAKLEQLKKQLFNQYTTQQMQNPDIRKQMMEETENLERQTKVYHFKQFKDFLDYGLSLRKLSDKDKIITADSLRGIISANIASQNHSLFSDDNIEWSSPSGIKAVAKFANLILKNDARKLQYYSTCLNITDKPLKLKTILDAPTPESSIHTNGLVKNMAARMQELEEKLNKTEGLFHVNSAEFKAMKAAVKAVNQGLANGISSEELGSRFEALHAASMDYVTAKGVGTQATQRGIDRMDAALDICSVAADGMDCFTSKERRAAIKEFEEKNFGKAFTTDFSDSKIAPVKDVYEKAVFDTSMTEPEYDPFEM